MTLTIAIATTYLNIKKAKEKFLKYNCDTLPKLNSYLRGVLKNRPFALKRSTCITSYPGVDNLIEIFSKECKMPSNIIISISFLRAL